MILAMLFACSNNASVYGGGAVTVGLTAGETPAPTGTVELAGSDADTLAGAPAFEPGEDLCAGPEPQTAGWVHDNRFDEPGWTYYQVRACAPLAGELTGEHIPEGAELQVFLELRTLPAEGESMALVDAGATLDVEIMVPFEDADNGERWGGHIDLPTAGLADVYGDAQVTLTDAVTGDLALTGLPWEWRVGCGVEDCQGTVDLELSWALDPGVHP